MDFDEYDKIDDFELNEILWRAIKGKDAPSRPPSAGRSPTARSDDGRGRRHHAQSAAPHATLIASPPGRGPG